MTCIAFNSALIQQACFVGPLKWPKNYPIFNFWSTGVLNWRGHYGLGFMIRNYLETFMGQ